jgi:hypothetical protein
MALANEAGLEKAFFARSQRQRLNLVPALLSLFIPWMMFCFVYGLVSSSLHYHVPELSSALLWLSFAGVLSLGGIAVFKSIVRKRDIFQDYEPNWMMFIFLTTLVGWLVGMVLGRLNYQTFMQPFYDYTDLNTYVDVNPARTRGQQMMDAGRVTFAENTTVDRRYSMAFRNLDTYCVAPITVGNLPLQSYDFWAVGLGCCSAQAMDFRCGEYDNPRARSGLRMMSDEQQPFFQLAVRQAEGDYQIKAQHPLFFYWAEDASELMMASEREGRKWYLIGMITHFLWQSACVVAALVSFSRLTREK